MIKCFILKSKKNQGFGILEVLIAIGIIALVMGAVTLLGRAGINAAVIGKHRTQATFLAQEGMEIVRNIRDSNLINRSVEGWDDGLSCGQGGSCKILYGKLACGGEKWCLEPGEQDLGFYEPMGEQITYNRKIYIYQGTVGGVNDPGKVYRKVVVEMTWEDFGREHKVEMTTYLTNWKQI